MNQLYQWLIQIKHSSLLRQGLTWIIMGLNVSLWFSQVAKAYFMDDALGARPAGMGEAFVSVADDANTILFNPAGLARIQNIELSGMYANLYADLKPRLYTGEYDQTGYNFICCAVPISPELGTLGAAWTHLYSTFYQENSFFFSYGRHLWNEWALDIGFNLRGLQWQVVDNDFTPDSLAFEHQKVGLTGDLGLFFVPEKGWQCGAGVEHIIPVNMGVTTVEYVPSVIHLGVSYKWLKPEKSFDWIQPALEFTARKGIYRLKFGIEAWFFKQILAIRAGIHADGFASGLSIQYPWPDTPLGFQVDYGFTYPFNLVDTFGSHRLGVTLYWDKEYESKKAAQAAKVLAAEEAAETERKKAIQEAIAAYQNELAVREAEAGQILAAARQEEAVKAEAQAKALQAAEEKRISNFVINQQDKIIIAYERQILSDFADIQEVKKWISGLEKYLEAQADIDLEPREYDSLDDLAHDFENGEIDIAVGYNHAFRMFYQQGIAVPLLTYQKDKCDYQPYCLFVRDDQEIKTLADLQGKRLGYLRLDSLTRLKTDFFPDDPLFQPENFFSSIKQMPHAIGSILALQVRDVDVVVAFDYLSYVYQHIQDRMPKSIKVIAKSEKNLVPNAPLFMRASLNIKKKQKIRNLVEKALTLHLEPKGKIYLTLFGFEKFIPFLERKYKAYYLSLSSKQ